MLRHGNTTRCLTRLVDRRILPAFGSIEVAMKVHLDSRLWW